MESNGRFKIDYDYTDLEAVKKTTSIWKYKYLSVIPENEYGRKVLEEFIKSNKINKEGCKKSCLRYDKFKTKGSVNNFVGLDFM